MNCINCNGIGYTAISGDNDTECKLCGGTGEQPVITYYLFDGKYMNVFPFNSRAEAERHNQRVCGGSNTVMEVIEQPRQALIDDEWGESGNSYGAYIDEQNEHYSNKGDYR